MDNPNIQGILGVVPTPLNNEGEVDEAGLEALLEHCASSGLHGAVVLGSTGEFPYFGIEEKKRIISRAGRLASGLPIVAGVSAFSTRESEELAMFAREAGCAAVLAGVPVYYQLSPSEVKYHLDRLHRSCGLPVIFYHYPETMGLSLSLDDLQEIAEIEGVQGAKITVLNRAYLKNAIKYTRADLWDVFTGTSFMLSYAMDKGGAGVICPLPLIAPEECLQIYDLSQKGKLAEAEKIQERLYGSLPIFSGLDLPEAVAVPYFKAMLRKPYTGPGERRPSMVALVKEALRLRGHPITSVVRRPCSPLSPEQADLVAKTMKEMGWLPS